VTKQHYGIKVSTLLNAANKITDDLDYLYSLVENPDPEFVLVNALSYAHAVVSLSIQLDFIIEDLGEKDLSEDELYVKLSQEDVMTMTLYTEASEDALEILEETCGISLQNN
jgi:hypothetical protein